MFNVAMLSKWHVHAEEYARFISHYPGCRITCVWDERAERGKKWAEELGADFEPDLEKVYARADVDGVMVTSPTSMHTEIMLAAAKAKKHIFTEKVLTITAKEAYAVRDAVIQNGVKLCISFPQRTRPEYLYAKKAVDGGLLGDVTMLRIRNGHSGASSGWLPDYWYDPKTAGGGALIDLGCHPMYLARWLLGEPLSVNATFGYYTGREVEDSAVCGLVFKNKAVAVVETSLCAHYAPYMFEIYGTKGSLIIRGGKVELKSALEGDELKVIDKESLPAYVKPAIEQWVLGCTKGEKIEFGIDDAVQLTEMMEAAYASQREGKTVYFG